MSGDGSLLEFVSGMKRAREPGTFCQYNSADTQVLGHLLINAIGRTTTDYRHTTVLFPQVPGIGLFRTKLMTESN